MTDITTTAPITIRCPKLPRLSLPKVAIGVSLDAIARHLGHAFNFAYVDPYTSLRRQPPIIPDNDLEGRDPNW